jgi:hypothetical protein
MDIQKIPLYDGKLIEYPFLRITYEFLPNISLFPSTPSPMPCRYSYGPQIGLRKSSFQEIFAEEGIYMELSMLILPSESCNGPISEPQTIFLKHILQNVLAGQKCHSLYQVSQKEYLR